MDQSEIEDIVPFEFLEKGIERLLGVQDEDDEFEYDESKPIIPQIECYAEAHGIVLNTGWKVVLAKAFKKQIFAKKKKTISDEYIEKWTKLFESLV